MIQHFGMGQQAFYCQYTINDLAFKNFWSPSTNKITSRNILIYYTDSEQVQGSSIRNEVSDSCRAVVQRRERAYEESELHRVGCIARVY